MNDCHLFHTIFVIYSNISMKIDNNIIFFKKVYILDFIKILNFVQNFKRSLRPQKKTNLLNQMAESAKKTEKCGYCKSVHVTSSDETAAADNILPNVRIFIIFIINTNTHTH